MGALLRKKRLQSIPTCGLSLEVGHFKCRPFLASLVRVTQWAAPRLAHTQIYAKEHSAYLLISPEDECIMEAAPSQ